MVSLYQIAKGDAIENGKAKSCKNLCLAEWFVV